MFALVLMSLAITPLEGDELPNITLTWRTGEMSKDASSQESKLVIDRGVLTYSTRVRGRDAGLMPDEPPKSVTLTAVHAAKLYPLIDEARKARSASLWSRPFQGRYIEVALELPHEKNKRIELRGPLPKDDVLVDDRGQPAPKVAKHTYAALNALHTALMQTVMGLER